MLRSGWKFGGLSRRQPLTTSVLGAWGLGLGRLWLLLEQEPGRRTRGAGDGLSRRLCTAAAAANSGGRELVARSKCAGRRLFVICTLTVFSPSLAWHGTCGH